MKRSLVLLAWLACAPMSPARADDAFGQIALRDVKVGGEIGRRIDVTIANNLLKIDVDKDFLAPFRTQEGKGGYIGLGKLIDATARFAVYSGDPRVAALKDRLVAETIALQGPDGYIGLMDPAHRVTALWDVHEMGYLVYGLLTVHELYGDEKALAAAKRLADFVLEHGSQLPPDWPARTHVATHVAITGLHRTLLRLEAVTRDHRYGDFCRDTLRLASWDPGIVVGRRDGIQGHVYAYTASCLAQLELQRQEGGAALLVPTNRALAFLTKQDGLAITGGVGQAEIWTDDQDGRGDLGETCATAYLLRLYDEMLRREGDPWFGDVMERTIHNALFAAQSPDGRHLRYYSPFEGERVYFPGDTYCCPCNYRRIVAELPQMVYYDAGHHGVGINLYTASRATFHRDKGESITIRQETDYPSSGRVVVQVDPSQAMGFPVKLRIPRWCEKASASVNGEPVKGPIASGSFLTIERTWKAGDAITLELSMPWRLVEGRKRQAGRVALMRGPVVFGLDPSQNEALAKKDAADLTKLVIDRAGLGEPIPCDAVRPGGVACRVKASAQPFAMDNPGELALTFTEFADPNVKAIYFRVPDRTVAVPDELLR